MRIGIFGGSFDPPHSAHLRVTQAARQQLKLDRILWVPAMHPPHKNLPKTPFEYRLGMVQALIREEPFAELSNIESTLPSPSYTLQTLKALKLLMGENHVWFLIIGADNWANFSQWHQPNAVMQEASLAVYPRYGISLSSLPAKVTLLDCPEIPMESTQFREQLKSNPEQTLAKLPPSVVGYIRQHNLYGISGTAAS